MRKLKILLAGFFVLLLAGTATAADYFPADEAGISAWVKAKESIDLDAVKPVLDTIQEETSDHIIGTVALDFYSETEHPSVYVSKDGYIVAYYPKDYPSSLIFPWYDYAGGSILSTTLEDAIREVCDEITGECQNIAYYDFKYPKATKMMILIESTSTSDTWFGVEVPSNYTTYRVDWSHYCDGCGATWNYAKLDGTTFSSVKYNRYNYGSFKPYVDFPNGVEHSIDLTRNSGTPRVGLVLLYAE